MIPVARGKKVLYMCGFFTDISAEVSFGATNTLVEFLDRVTFAARLALALGRYFSDARNKRG